MSQTARAVPVADDDAAGHGLVAALLAAAAMRPQAIACAQPARRETVTDSSLGEMTFTSLADASRRLASLFALAKLPRGASVLVQAPLGPEMLVTMAAAHACGLRPLVVPLTAGPALLQDAMEAAGPAIAIGLGRFGDLVPAEALRDAAARALNVRLVFGFGGELPDGVAPVDPLLTSGAMPLADAALQTTEAGRIGFSGETVGALPTIWQEDVLARAALDIARLLGPPSSGRLMSLMTAASPGALAAGPYFAWLSGLTFLPMGLFSLGSLWAALADTQATLLVAPASIEAALRGAGVFDHPSLVGVILVGSGEASPGTGLPTIRLSVDRSGDLAVERTD